MKESRGNLIPKTMEAYKLLHDGALALSQVEANGIRIDTDRIQGVYKEIDGKIKEIYSRLQADSIHKAWSKYYGKRMNLSSREQLGVILFNKLGYPCKERTVTGKPKCDEGTLAEVDSPFVRDYILVEKYKKAKKFVEGISNETVDGILHPFFNLHTVQTFRSSSDSPNFQNLPSRIPEMAKLVRECIIPRKGRILLEVDYSGIEVRIAACYHKDPVMIEYIQDTTKDMHRDMAAQCYSISPDEVTKQSRYCAKNQFVFPQFYGDYYVNCARHLWESLDKLNLTTKSGKNLKEHLRENGINKLGDSTHGKPSPGTFEYHIKEVEEDFWGNRFCKYAQWKNKWWRDYLEKGEIYTLTGFMVRGVYKKNEIINYPVQGSAFHCLLWSLIRLQKWLVNKGMKSLLIAQIHDSLLLDVVVEELPALLKRIRSGMIDNLIEFWKWIIVPLDIEAEVSKVDGNWHEKEKVKI